MVAGSSARGRAPAAASRRGAASAYSAIRAVPVLAGLALAAVVILAVLSPGKQAGFRGADNPAATPDPVRSGPGGPGEAVASGASGARGAPGVRGTQSPGDGARQDGQIPAERPSPAASALPSASPSPSAPPVLAPAPATRDIGARPADPDTVGGVGLAFPAGPIAEAEVVSGDRLAGLADVVLFRNAKDYAFQASVTPLAGERGVVVEGITAEGREKLMRARVVALTNTRESNAEAAPLLREAAATGRLRVVVSHNEDDPPDEVLWRGILDGAPHLNLYGLGILFRHPRAHAVPYSVANSKYRHGNKAVWSEASGRSFADRPASMVVPQLSTATNKGRAAWLAGAARAGFGMAGGTAPEDYPKVLARARFVLAPEGHSPDTHRLWETVYSGSVPVLQDTAFTAMLRDHCPGFDPVVCRGGPDGLKSVDFAAEAEARKGRDYRRLMPWLRLSWWRALLDGYRRDAPPPLVWDLSEMPDARTLASSLAVARRFSPGAPRVAVVPSADWAAVAEAAASDAGVSVAVVVEPAGASAWAARSGAEDGVVLGGGTLLFQEAGALVAGARGWGVAGMRGPGGAAGLRLVLRAAGWAQADAPMVDFARSAGGRGGVLLDARPSADAATVADVLPGEGWEWEDVVVEGGGGGGARIPVRTGGDGRPERAVAVALAGPGAAAAAALLAAPAG